MFNSFKRTHPAKAGPTFEMSARKNAGSHTADILEWTLIPMEPEFRFGRFM